jgi:ankyrin repeat protein
MEKEKKLNQELEQKYIKICDSGRVEDVKSFIESNGIDVNYDEGMDLRYDKDHYKDNVLNNTRYPYVLRNRLLNSLRKQGIECQIYSEEQAGAYCLYKAAVNNLLDEVKAIIAGGVDVNAREPLYNAISLHGAVFARHIEAVKFLLDNGADLTLPNRQL